MASRPVAAMRLMLLRTRPIPSLPKPPPRAAYWRLLERVEWRICHISRCAGGCAAYRLLCPATYSRVVRRHKMPGALSLLPAVTIWKRDQLDSADRAPGPASRNLVSMSVEHVDVLIVGAGLSGIGAACHLLGGPCWPAPPASSRSSLRHPRGARRHRRHLGPVPVPGHPLRLGHVHARLRIPAVDGAAGDRRRRDHPRLRAADGPRVRRGRPHPLPAPGGAGRVVRATPAAGRSPPCRRRRRGASP